jgi:capsular exopolysaccharide synthesis family protein
MQEPVPEYEATPDLRAYLSVLRRRKWSILTVTAVAVASALAFSFRQTPIYTSTAKIQVKPPTANQYLQNVPVSSIVSMDTERQIAASTKVAELAAERLGTARSAEDLLDHLDVSVPTNTQILEISYSDPDPAAAQAGAQAFAQAYLEFKIDQATAAFASVEEALTAKIKQLQQQLATQQQKLAAADPGSPEQAAAQAEIDVLTTRIATYENRISDLGLIDLDPGEVIQPADLPRSPSSPNHVVNGGLALALGLALGVGLAFLRERLDDRVPGRAGFEEAIEAPTLAIVPRIPSWRRRDRTELPALSAPDGSVAEAFRTIRTNLLFMARDGGIKTVGIMSPGPGEGKTTVTANLAVSLAQADKRVIVVSCDLRKPRLHRFFNLANDIGVTSVLAGTATLNDAVLRPVGVPMLRLVASGPVPHNPSELLSSERMEALLAQLRRVADFVVVDTAPGLSVSDGIVLAPKMDAVIVVADAASTSLGALRHLRDQLEQVGANVIGGVLNDFDPDRARGYEPAYGYAYYGGRYRYQAGAERRGRQQASTQAPEDGRAPEEIWRTEDIWS